MTIPVLKPSITEEEIQAVVEVMRSGWLGLGPKTNEFEEKFAAYVNAKFCVALNSCTAALHLAMAALNLQPEDEVIVTPMTFISTVHSISYCGAKPVFADILPDNFNINPDDVAQKLSAKTRAIIAVDMAGHPCDLDELMKLAADHGLAFVEDAAHSCGALYKNKPIGSIAPFTCFSFHAVKNLTCGEGGAITGNDEWYRKWFSQMRWLGISKDTWSRSGEKQGYQWKYWVENLGFKYHMNDLAAAIGLVQLKRLEQLNEARRKIVTNYSQAFSKLDWLTTPEEKPYVQSSWHLYQVKLATEKMRDRLINHLLEQGITPGVHYLPAHLHPYYRHFKATCPVASEIWQRIISLPIYPDLTVEDQEKVIAAVKNFKV
jgi:Predicted pyridoxal phosphate-dependent enzyme apparently involved in regulation of cell wall biogenesis